MVTHDIGITSFLDSRMSSLRFVLPGKCADHGRRAWTTCCSSRQSPDEARLRDGSFDRWDVDQAFSVEWKMNHAHALSKSMRTRWFEKSADVRTIVRNGSRSPQWCGARWRRQSTVVSAATSPRSTFEITCNQVNFLRNHDGTKSENELLGNAFLLDVDVAHM